jgi:hypothetical protein
VLAEATIVPCLAADAGYLEALGEFTSFRESDNRRHQVAAGEVAGGTQDDESGRRGHRPVRRARFIPDETTPTWLNGLRVVPEEGTRAGIDLLGQQPQRPAPRAERVVQLERLVGAALVGQVVHQPEAAEQ